jgi:hypothetical protein
LGVQRLTGGRSGWIGERAGGLAHYAGREPGVLDIFSEYSLKIPQIYSNILEYFFVERAWRSTGQGRRVDDLGGWTV